MADLDEEESSSSIIVAVVVPFFLSKDQELLIDSYSFLSF
jgi:hypothetical protein